MSLLKALAPSNMPCMLVTLAVFHLSPLVGMGWLNAAASLNMFPMLVTRPVFQALMPSAPPLLNAAAPLNMDDMSVTLDTSQVPMKKRRRAFSPVFGRGLPVPFSRREREAPPRIAPIRLGLGGARRPVYVCSGGGRGRARLLVRSHGTRTRPHVDVVGDLGQLCLPGRQVLVELRGPVEHVLHGGHLARVPLAPGLREVQVEI